MLFLIGLGSGDAKDITLNGLEAVKRSKKVYLENYTSILTCDQKELEDLYGKPVTPVDRDMMEQGCSEILDIARDADAAVLVVGDPLNATTHTDLILRATELGIEYKIIHNASILNAVACCGLQIYNFGETVSIPFWTDTWKPDSFYDKILRNRKNGLHTLCLLDIKMKEPNLELLARGIIKMEPPKLMTVAQAAEQLLAIVKSRGTNEEGDPVEKTSQPDVELHDDSMCICLARVGSATQEIVKSNLSEAAQLDLGGPLHSLVIPGQMHPLEVDMVELFNKAKR